MSTPIPFFARLGIILSTLFWAFLASLFLIGTPLILNTSTTLAGGLAAAALILAILVTWLLRVVSYQQSLRSFFVVIIKPFLLLLFVFVSLLSLPFYYLAYKAKTDPVLLPQTVLSNGEKTLIFQGITHIGSEHFYKSIGYDLETALNEGYKVFYEGIKLSSPENDSWFSQTIGDGDPSKSYKDLALACNLQFQSDYFQLIDHDQDTHPDQHLMADPDTSQVKVEYDRLMRDDTAFSFTMKMQQGYQENHQQAQHLSTLIEWVKQGIGNQHPIVGTLCQGLFTRVLDPSKTSAPPLNKLLVDFRNKHLANTILTDTSNKIYIVYSANHLSGIFTLLHDQDPRWEIKSVKWLRDMDAPQQ